MQHVIDYNTNFTNVKNQSRINAFHIKNKYRIITTHLIWIPCIAAYQLHCEGHRHLIISKEDEEENINNYLLYPQP